MTVEEMRLAFAKNLKALMESSKSTQEDIAKVCGVSQQTVSDWLTAKKYPRMDKVQALLDHFNVPMAYLVNDGKNRPEPYYLDPETAQLATDFKNRPQILRIARLGKNLSEDDLKQIVQFTEFIVKKNGGNKLTDVDDDL